MDVWKNICWKYEQISIFSYNFEGPVAVVQLDTGMRPSPLFLFRALMEKFVACHQGDESENVPTSLGEVQDSLNFELVYNGSKDKDVDGIGFAPHRVALYTVFEVSAIKRIIMLLDEYLAWRHAFSDTAVECLPEKPKMFIHCSEDVVSL